MVSAVGQTANDHDALADFLAQFDEYVTVRASLRNMEDGSDDERYCIADCAERWNRLVRARENIK